MAEEIDRDVRVDEAWKANIKRTYDLYQDLDVQNARNLQNVALQALQNAVTNAHAITNQTIRHEALAADRQWNVDEQGYTVESILGNQAFKDAIEAAVAKKVQESVEE